MRFLCLHGAIGNIDNINIQLDPLVKQMATDGFASFHYINGPVLVSPPAGFTEYFGIGPHYRWLEDGGVAENSMISRVRKSPHGSCPEDVMRALGNGWDGRWINHHQVMEYLYDTLEKNPDIEGIIGYSEGATMAASLILDEDRKAQETGRPRRIRCAIFITGWPPLSPEEDVVLADESDYTLDIPTLHVVGADGNSDVYCPVQTIYSLFIFGTDPYRYGALALFNICDPDTAAMFDTGRGHTIPRSGPVITELGNAVRDLIDRAYQG
ncbi:CAZyme family CE5 [Penicillium psychrosexuale]|uniref:CAZyme family CE5 n=1 Tax=Penicillium psychrosexuale TaxID=1002107 RepID=UPI002545B53B|nr:CAZyme family CE5 [Penicillium psychrosexuale]KAJ5799991.1 CAZyme family CE5 [Penicillium psychrosexuale]